MSFNLRSWLFGAGGGGLALASLTALIYFPSYLLWNLFILLGLSLVLSLLALGRKRRRCWAEIFLGLVIIIGNFSFVLLLAGTPVRWAMLGIAALMTALWSWNLASSQINGGLNRGLGLISLFFIAYGLDTIGNFFSLAQWQIMAAFFVLSLMVAGPALSVLGEISAKVWLHSLVVALALTQLWWCLGFWPTTLMTKSLIVVATAYFLLSVASRELVGSLDAKKTWRYGLLSALIILLALLTSPWVLTS